MEISVKRGLPSTFDIDLIDSNLSGSYVGTTLTGVSVVGSLFNDTGESVNWELSNEPAYDTGWKYTLTLDETNYDYANGTILITSNEAEPFFVVVTFDSEGMIIRGVENIIPLEFIDSVLPGVYAGTTLSNVVVTGSVYNDVGASETWTISGLPVYVSGKDWTLTINSGESNKNFFYGTVVITADEIEPLQLNFEFGGLYYLDLSTNLNFNIDLNAQLKKIIILQTSHAYDIDLNSEIKNVFLLSTIINHEINFNGQITFDFEIITDILTQQEESIGLLLSSIDGTLQPTGYQYYTTTGSVNIEDKVLAMANMTDKDSVIYTVEQLDNTESALEQDMGFNFYSNQLQYQITASVSNVGNEPNPKYSIKEKCNQVLSDLKYLFGTNYTLNGKCEIALYNGSNRVYTNMNNIKRTAKLNFILIVTYSQNINNPDVIVCDA